MGQKTARKRGGTTLFGPAGKKKGAPNPLKEGANRPEEKKKGPKPTLAGDLNRTVEMDTFSVC